MSNLSNLAFPDNIALKIVACQVIDLAYDDHQTNKRHRTGSYLCERFCSNYRILHERFCSTIYNKTRESLEAGEKEMARGTVAN